ncbi:MAG: chitobiase/beta-hexosaminidase C-terminal domain-containing protein [Candidatus Cloacimonadales bacterium]
MPSFKQKIIICILGSLLPIYLVAAPQFYPRHNYFMPDQSCELILELELENSEQPPDYQLFLDDKLLAAGQLSNAARNFISFPAQLLLYGASKLDLHLDNSETSISLTVTKLPAKADAVQIDNLTGGLLLEGEPFLPFGFYTYWPLQARLPENEVVQGFNLISPYHKILEDDFQQRLAYLDRCAELGIKVNYNLCSLAGGGGVGTARFDLPEKKLNTLLRREIEALKDHPAILSWYIADEPVLTGVKPEYLQKKYDLIKSIDPYHPVSIVFLRPDKAGDYQAAMDIAMVDPYPVPTHPLTLVGDRTRILKNQLPHSTAIWVVPQAFGGGEWWQREPTRQELRNMTYQAIINGGRGIKYFVRKGLNSFPKSTSAWAEAATVALEMQELAPQILSAELAPEISCQQPQIQVQSYQHDGLITVLAVNTTNTPTAVDFHFPALGRSGLMKLPFENREVALDSGSFSDLIDAYGTRCYQYELSPAINLLSADNLTYNGDFEEYFSPGVVAGFYASVRQEPGVTYFSDSSVAFSGRRSLRLHNPVANQGVRLRSFPVQLKANQSYILSIKARAKNATYTRSKKLNFWQKLFGAETKEEAAVTFRLALDSQQKIFSLSADWQEFTLDIPAQPDSRKRVISLELLGKGTAWFDLMQVVPGLHINSRFAQNSLWVEINTSLDDFPIHYTTDGTPPSANSTLYTQPFQIFDSSLITAARIIEQQAYNLTQRKIITHRAIGKPVEYQRYYRQYTAGGEQALVDGIFGSTDYQDGKWQGFLYDDLEVIIDLEEWQEIKQVKLNFLENHHSWIFLPSEVTLYISPDGENFSEIDSTEYEAAQQYRRSPQIYPTILQVNDSARYLKIVAQNLQYCPAWHRGSGRAAWLFVDEISVE